jgi:hypothetical protein
VIKNTLPAGTYKRDASDHPSSSLVVTRKCGGRLESGICGACSSSTQAAASIAVTSAIIGRSAVLHAQQRHLHAPRHGAYRPPASGRSAPTHGRPSTAATPAIKLGVRYGWGGGFFFLQQTSLFICTLTSKRGLNRKLYSIDPGADLGWSTLRF